MGYTVGDSKSSANFSDINLGSFANKKYTLNERRQNDSMHYEEIDYSSIADNKKYEPKETNSEIPSLYKDLGISEDAAKRMYNRVKGSKDSIDDLNKKLEDYISTFNRRFDKNLADKILDRANDGNLLSKIASVLTFANHWNHDVAVAEQKFGEKNRTITVEGDKIVVKEYNETIYTYEDGLCTSIEYAAGLMIKISYSPNGEAYDISYSTKNEQPISIFGDYNKANGQYGGNQCVFRDYNAELLEDPIIRKMLEDTFPGASDEDYSNYLYALCSVGCGYTALINMVFQRFEGKENEFEEKFGFPMYKIGDNGLDFNYEYLILALFNHTWGEKTNYSIQELYGEMTKEKATDGSKSSDINMIIHGNHSGGTSAGNNYKIASNTTALQWLFDEYGIAINRVYYDAVFVKKELYAEKDILYGSEEWKKYMESKGYIYNENVVPDGSIMKIPDLEKTYENIKKFLDKKLKEGQVIISVGNFNLYDIITEKLSHKDVDFHAMSIIGTTSEGIIVSSWGKQYLLKYDEILNQLNLDLNIFENEE